MVNAPSARILSANSAPTRVNRAMCAKPATPNAPFDLFLSRMLGSASHEFDDDDPMIVI
jgi:hypothetical protein